MTSDNRVEGGGTTSVQDKLRVKRQQTDPTQDMNWGAGYWGYRLHVGYELMVDKG